MDAPTIEVNLVSIKSLQANPVWLRLLQELEHGDFGEELTLIILKDPQQPEQYLRAAQGRLEVTDFVLHDFIETMKQECKANEIANGENETDEED